MDKKAIKMAREALDLHVLLIMRQDVVSKPVALGIAYAEGEKGLARRLAPAPVVRSA